MNHGRNISNEFLSDHAISAADVPSAKGPQLASQADSHSVFVVHGRNEAAREAMFSFLRAIALHPIEWTEACKATGAGTPYIGEILDEAFLRARAILVLFTPDDEARLKEDLRKPDDLEYEAILRGQARPNVLFEAGMAMGRSDVRTILVELGELRPFSDLAGRHVIRLDGSTQRRQELAQRLQAAGCPVNLDGIDWHTAGDFATPLALAASEKGETEALQDATISEDAQNLLLSAAAEDNTSIAKHATRGGSILGIGGRKFRGYREPRSRARWVEALRELVDAGLVEDSTGNDEMFEVTHRGFQVSDRLRGSV